MCGKAQSLIFIPAFYQIFQAWIAYDGPMIQDLDWVLQFTTWSVPWLRSTISWPMRVIARRTSSADMTVRPGGDASLLIICSSDVRASRDPFHVAPDGSRAVRPGPRPPRGWLRVADAPRGGADDSIGVVGLDRCEGTRSGQSWMMTVEPIGISSAPQMKSIAGFVTRT